ncbi:MAG: aminotransferase class IV [Candidatus Desulforudis sp.]|nr:aminotransferase class IV [Desulforudis sp.]
MTELAYLDGRITAVDQARVSIDDRAFLFGDGIYEVVRSYGGVFFGLEEHMARMARSAAAIEMELPLSEAGFVALVRELRQKSEIDDAMVYIQVSRGVEPRRHIYDPGLKPQVLITVRHVPHIPERYWTHGVTAVTVPDIRWGMCHVKATSLMANIMAGHRARQNGADEAIFVRDDGTVTEAYASNVFIVRDGEVWTHPLNNRILGGITRQFVLELCSGLGVPFREAVVTREEMRGAGEVFLTNSVHEVRAAVEIDGRPVADGRPGPVTGRLIQAYKELVRLRTGSSE